MLLFIVRYVQTVYYHHIHYMSKPRIIGGFMFVFTFAIYPIIIGPLVYISMIKSEVLDALVNVDITMYRRIETDQWVLALDVSSRKIFCF